jgi:hypothetical protein
MKKKIEGGIKKKNKTIKKEGLNKIKENLKKILNDSNIKQ